MWDSNLTDEWFSAVTTFHLSWEEVVALGRTSLTFAFLPDEVKSKLLEEYERDLAAFVAKYDRDDWRKAAASVEARPSGYARRNLLPR
jgi:adenosine deaminase CECR1